MQIRQMLKFNKNVISMLVTEKEEIDVRKGKRLLCILLVLCMVLSLLPGAVLAAGGVFADVQKTDWFYEEVQYVYSKGLMKGTGTDTFSPGLTTTRGMIVTILWRLEGEPSAKGTQFADVAEAQKLYENVRVPEKDNLMGKWYFATPERRPFVIKEVIEKLPRFAMRLEYDLSDGQIKLQPTVRSVIDAAYYALGRFAAVNAGALDDYGGKTNIAFCQACGRAFIKRGNRQKYCGTTLCQSIRNNRKSSDYYYRKKTGGRGEI